MNSVPLVASLMVICGPMKSGKSRELFSIIDRLNYQKGQYTIFKPKIDSRNLNTVSSRYLSQSNEAIIIPESNPAEILNYLSFDKDKESINPHTILIDEAHFFSQELVDVVKCLLSRGINVVVSGLDLDSQLHTFGPMGDLLALANKIKKLSSVCECCYGSANCSALKKSAQNLPRGNILVGTDQYLTLCLSCYLKHTNWSSRLENEEWRGKKWNKEIFISEREKNQL